MRWAAIGLWKESIYGKIASPKFVYKLEWDRLQSDFNNYTNCISIGIVL